MLRNFYDNLIPKRHYLFNKVQTLCVAKDTYQTLWIWLFDSKGGFPVMAETSRNHIFSKEISQVIIAAMVLAPNFY